jgi:hypothetical protein
MEVSSSENHHIKWRVFAMFGYQRACVDILGIQTIQICATAGTHMGG